MIAALAYLYTRSLKNRLLTRIKRLKRPKYLFGAIVGGLYFYFYFFRYLFQGRLTGPRAKHDPMSADWITPEVITSFEWLGALMLFAFLAAAWLFPKPRAVLDFTEAEIAFLFPAPVSRKTLIHFKLIRSQIGILFSAVFFALISGRFAGGSAWIHALGWWVILSAMNLHYLGCSFVQTLLFDRGISTAKRRAAAVGILGLVLAAVWLWAGRTMRLPATADLNGVPEFARYLQGLAEGGPLYFLLFPFRLLVRPFLAPDAMAMALAIGPALLMVALHYWWVVRMDVSFEEASLEAAQKRMAMVEAVRSGNLQALRPAAKRKAPWFTLGPAGPRIAGLLWKNLVQARQMITLRVWAGLAVVLTAGGLIAGRQGEGWDIVPGILGTVTTMLLLWSILVGPQVVRYDLRQDIQTADLLKQYPLHGWEIVLGELLAPAVILTAAQWSLLLMAMILGGDFLVKAKVLAGHRIAIGLAIAAVVPALNLLSLIIPNGAVLAFPAWFRPSGEPQHGMEMTGQRIIMVVGQLLILALSLLPATAVFAAVFFLGRAWLGLGIAIPLAAMGASLVILAEAAGGIYLLGKLFERLDLAAESN